MAKSLTRVDPIAAAVLILCEAFGRQATETTVEAYRIGLAGVPESAIKVAMANALQRNKFMPSPVELRELAGELNLSDRAVIAHQKVTDAMKTIGCYRSVDFDDPAINATVKALGGWELIGAIPLADWHSFTRKRFIETYLAYTRRGVTADEATPCIGSFDRENAFNGFKSPNPVMRIETELEPAKLLHGAVRDTKPRIRGPKKDGEPKRLGDVFDKDQSDGEEKK